MPLFASQPLLFEPGTKQQYSNGGFVVLGLIIEKISGKSYYDYVKEHVFEPAGMKDTDFYLTGQKVGNCAEGYTMEQSNGSSRRNNESSRPARGSSAGGGYSTAHDLLNFTRAIAGRKLTAVSPETGQPVLEGMGVGGGARESMRRWNSIPGAATRSSCSVTYDPPTAEKAAQQIRKWMKAVRD